MRKLLFALWMCPLTMSVAAPDPEADAAHATWETGFSKASAVKFGDEGYDEARAKYSMQHPEPRATISDRGGTGRN